MLAIRWASLDKLGFPTGISVAALIVTVGVYSAFRMLAK